MVSGCPFDSGDGKGRPAGPYTGVLNPTTSQTKRRRGRGDAAYKDLLPSVRSVEKAVTIHTLDGNC